MSQIDNLIRKYAPNGVTHLAIGAISSKTTNVRWSSVGDRAYKYIDLSSVDRITHKIGDTALVTAGDAPSRAQQIVSSGDVIFATTRPTQMRWAVIPPDYDGQVASTGYCVLRPDETVILTNFLAHVLGTEAFRKYIETNQVLGNYPSIPDKLIRAYRIPVPPLEVQREVVRILDEFAALAESLAVELHAEVDARSVQYSAHRSSLMSLDGTDVSWPTLGEVATVRTGQAPAPGTLADDGLFPFVNAGSSASGHVTVSNTPGDTVTIPSRGQGSIGIAGYQASEFWCGPLCYRIRAIHPGLLNRFLFHYLKAIQEHIRGLQQTGGTPALNRKELVLVKVPLAPIAEQERIVRILDEYERRVSELVSVLPAEVDARRRQYEYYRDRLLTFEELAS